MDFDNEALIRAVIIAVATGLLLNGILKLLLHGTDKWNRWKVAMPLILAGIALIIAVGVYYSWPSLVKVPVLDNLSEDEAKDVLERKRLVPHPEPRYSIIERGRVIPNSQNPPAGQSVKKKKIVEFAIAVNEPAVSSQPPPDSNQNVSIFQPKSGENFYITKSGIGLYTGEVRGTFAGLKKDRDFLLLWIRPIDPPSDKSGWYLQRHPNGIRGLKEDGSWIGSVQVGNTSWPPKEGDIIDIAVSVVDKTAYQSFMAQGGEAMSQEPAGSIVDKASEVVIKIK